MKVPDNLIYSVFQRQDQLVRENLVKKTLEIGTGKRVFNIGDDPGTTYNIIQLKKEITELSQFSRNRLFADVNLSYADYTLSKVEDYLKELYTKTVQAKSQTVTPDALVAMSEEFGTAIRFLLDRANERLGENYIFSGSALTTKPFDNNYAYRGSQEEFNVQIDAETFVPVFTSGEVVFTTNVVELDASFASPDDVFTLGGDGVGQIDITYKGTTYSFTYDNDPATPDPSTLQELVDAINATVGPQVRAFVHEKEDGTYTLRLIPEETSQPITVAYNTAVTDPSEELGSFNYLNIFQITDRIYKKLQGGINPDDSDLTAINRAYDHVAFQRSRIGSVLVQVKQQEPVQQNKEDVLNKQKSDNEDADISQSIMEYTRYRLAYEALMRIVADTRDMTILRYV